MLQTFCLQKSSSHNQPLNGLHGPHTEQLVSAWAKIILPRSLVSLSLGIKWSNNQQWLWIIERERRGKWVIPRHQKSENLLPWFGKYPVDIPGVLAKSWKFSILISSATSNLTSTISTRKKEREIQYIERSRREIGNDWEKERIISLNWNLISECTFSDKRIYTWYRKLTES